MWPSLLVLPSYPAGSASTFGSDPINNFSHAHSVKADLNYRLYAPSSRETNSHKERKEAFLHGLDPSWKWRDHNIDGKRSQNLSLRWEPTYNVE